MVVNGNPDWLRGGLLGALLLVVAACAATPRVDVASDPGADFGRYATFTFHEPLHTDRESGVGTVLSQLLRSLAMTELQSRGYVYVTENADLEVNFFVETREKLESVPDPDWGWHYGYWNYPYGVWTGYGYGGERIRQYTVGSLHLDVVDLTRKQLVWEAVAVGRVKTDFSYEQEDVRRAMVEMFAGFPARSAP